MYIFLTSLWKITRRLIILYNLKIQKSNLNFYKIQINKIQFKRTYLNIYFG